MTATELITAEALEFAIRGVGQAVGEELKVLREQMDELIDSLLAHEGRISGMEQLPALRFRGRFQPSDQYERGDMVSHRSCLWVATAETAGVRPAEGGCWRLVIRGSHRRGGQDDRD